jgi:ubiquinone/menaquinone biosynthesis C-methylase UbiE
MDQLGAVGAAVIERLDIAEDHQHLDLASGTGEPGLSIARQLPKRRVLLDRAEAVAHSQLTRRSRDE